MYKIDFDAKRNWLEIAVGGFWSADEIDAFIRDLGQAMAAAPQPPMCLYNYTDAAIQSQEIVGLLQELARNVGADRKVAMYTEGRLARLQAKRVAAAGTRVAVFDSRDEAVAWLTAQGTRDSGPIGAAA